MEFSLSKYISDLPNQHNVGCCAASASLLAAEIMMATTGKSIKFSRLFVYYMARSLQGRLGQEGVALQATLESMKQYGSCTDSNWPFKYSRADREPTQFAIDDAKKYKIGSFSVADRSRFKEYLSNKIPIVAGLYTGKMFWRLKGPIHEQVYKPVNMADNRSFRAHAVTIVGYNDTICNGSWIVANSTGLTWGDHGFGILPYECMYDIGEAYIIDDIKDMSLTKNFL